MLESFIREMKRRILSLAHFAEYRLEKRHIEGLLKYYDPAPVENEKPQKCESIAFVITRMVRFHGGQTSVLRLGSELAKQGMKVYYLVYKRQSQEEMEFCAKENLAGFQGTCMAFGDYLKAVKKKKLALVDFVCATSWDTVSFAKKLTDSYKLYFVQDYEPYFYKYGEEFLMSRSTYIQGLHMISLGSWNRDMIMKDAVSGTVKPDKTGQKIIKNTETGRNNFSIDVVDFPYEPREYAGMGRRDYREYSSKKTITIAAYVKFYGKRLPAFIPYMLKNTAKKLKKRGITLNVLYFGEAKTFRAAGGKNLGQLNRSELTQLYKTADFGLVASMSNISLVPYEMHAAGLPVIEFADGTYTHFLPEDSAILTDIASTDIAQKIYEAVKNPKVLEKMHNSAMSAMKDLSWENTGKQFYAILKKTLL